MWDFFPCFWSLFYVVTSTWQDVRVSTAAPANTLAGWYTESFGVVSTMSTVDGFDGATTDAVVEGGTEQLQQAQVQMSATTGSDRIEVADDCLLYTSPSPRDRG